MSDNCSHPGCPSDGDYLLVGKSPATDMFLCGRHKLDDDHPNAKYQLRSWK